jgi:hypothetical protein
MLPLGSIRKIFPLSSVYTATGFPPGVVATVTPSFVVTTEGSSPAGAMGHPEVLWNDGAVRPESSPVLQWCVKRWSACDAAI